MVEIKIPPDRILTIFLRFSGGGVGIKRRVEIEDEVKSESEE